MTQRVDMLLGMFMLHEKRNQLADFPYPWAKTVAALMIPSAKIDEKTQSSFSKVDAVWKPFQMQVYTAVALNNLSINCRLENITILRFGSAWLFLYWLQRPVCTV